MATWNNSAKSATPTWTKPSESSTSWGSINQVKAGFGWLYNQVGVTYNGLNEPVSGNVLAYNSSGSLTTWSSQNKS